MEDELGNTSDSSEQPSGSEEEMGSWVSWFCSLKGNEFFCEVDEDYIQDDFNLSGLSGQVPYYEYALELILDAESVHDEILTDAQQAAVEAAAETLYGMIHARFILTARGLAAMSEKYKGCDFGRCPRVFCNSQPCLPVGLSDIPRQSTVKLFCPKCEDVFYPRSKYHGNLDGAYFGTTFPHLFLLTYPQLRPSPSKESYTPKVFGFKIHPSAYDNGTQGAALRQKQARRKEDASAAAKLADSSMRGTEDSEQQAQQPSGVEDMQPEEQNGGEEVSKAPGGDKKRQGSGGLR